MAHPRRREWVEGYLAPRLPAARVAWDRGEGEWDTATRALRAHEGAAWRVIVQDDALLARDFEVGVRRALEALEPIQPVSFYLGNVPKHAKVGGGAHESVDYAERVGATWLEMPGPWWAVAFAVPADHVEQILERKSASNETDLRIATFYKLRGIECLYTIPSLADHRRVDVNPSIVGSPRDRHALRFHPGSALELDFTLPPARMHTRFRSLRNGREKIVRPIDLPYHDASPVWRRV